MLRFGVIGVGAMGRNHIRVLNEMESVKLVAVADIDRALVVKTAEHYHVAAYDDYRKMLQVEQLDAVSIVVPTTLHKQVSLDAMSSRIHVLLEKPIAASVEDAKAIIQGASENRVKLGIGHIERFNPAAMALKKRLELGELGALFEIRTRRLGPIPGRIQDVGVVIDLATHDIDLMKWLAGQPVKRLHAETQCRVYPDREDSFFGLIQFNNGVTGVLDVSWLVPTKTRQLFVVGGRGMFVVDTLTQELYFYENDYVVGEAPANTPIIEGNMIRLKVEKKEPLRLELESFVDAILGEGNRVVTGEEALENLELALAFMSSAQKGQVVTFD